jgi:hypothetical protein
MVTAIAPVVYGSQDRRERMLWASCAVCFAGSSLLSGAALGALVGWAGAVLSAHVGTIPQLVVFVLLCVVCGLIDLEVLRLPDAMWRRQVPSEWRHRFHPLWTATFYGSHLGIGYATNIPVASVHVAALAVLLTADPLLGGVLWGAFGAARALLVVALAAHRAYAFCYRGIPDCGANDVC